MSILFIIFFMPIVFSNLPKIYSHFNFFNVLSHDKHIFLTIKNLFIVTLFFSNIIIFHSILSFIIPKSNNKKENISKAPVFGLLIGKDKDNNKVYISEKGLYQNFLITGSIGSGKTSSAMYPFTKQLIKYKSYDNSQKLGFLILDVKGNYYSKVRDFAKEFNRLDDLIVIEVNGFYKYNPLDKPLLKSSVLANRLKTILLLFSPNNTESYWLDKVEQILEACINICRIYNNGYVNFEELHNLVTNYSYYKEKIIMTQKKFTLGKLSKADCYLLLNSILFLENDYFSLDSRTHNLLKSEITRITNLFVADYEINITFCPTKQEESFYGFDDVIKNGKIVVLNMNIAQYKNLSKVIAAYLKLDFQTDVLKQLSNSSIIKRSTVFISDEYQEYVTSSDADFFSQSREAKCINIVSTQSYTSIINSLKDQNSTKVIIQNLVNKLCFRTDDIFTIEEIQKQIGKEEHKRISKTFSENSKESTYSHLSKEFFSTNSSLSESVNSYYQKDFIFDYDFFTQQLNTFSCISFLSDGDRILKPCKLKMFPYFVDKN